MGDLCGFVGFNVVRIRKPQDFKIKFLGINLTTKVIKKSTKLIEKKNYTNNATKKDYFFIRTSFIVRLSLHFFLVSQTKETLDLVCF